MAQFVAFDKDGCLGPAVTLIFNFDALTLDQIKEVAELLEENYKKLSKRTPEKRDEFIETCVALKKIHGTTHPTCIVTSPFFQSMMYKINDDIDQLVLSRLIPNVMDTVKEKINVPSHITQWQPTYEFLAGLLQSYMTEEQIRQTCNLNMSKELTDERRKIGFDIDGSTITESDLNMIIHCLKAYDLLFHNSPNRQLAAQFIGRYMMLFSKSNEIVPSNVCNLLDTAFRNKKFSKKE